MKIGFRIKEERIRLGINQAELAKRALITPACLSQIEAGLRSPMVSILKKISNILGVSMDSLCDNENLNKMTTYDVSAQEQKTMQNWYYHPAKGDQSTRYQEINRLTREAAEFMLKHCPPSNEKSLAITSLQQARMWANASIAVNET